MALASAQKDISSHPAKNSVVDPVDKGNKEADLDRKIRFFGVIDAFRKGKLPSNAQIDKTLRYVLDHSPVDLDRLSPEGQKLIRDSRDIIDTARLMVHEKNADELFQNFVWHTRAIDTDDLKPGDLPDLPVDGRKAKTDSERAIKHLRTLLTLVLTNSEVRKLLYDFSVIGRDLLAISATKTAEKIAPQNEELGRVNDSAPHDQFITQGGRVAQPGETPVLDFNAPGVQQQQPEGDVVQSKGKVLDTLKQFRNGAVHDVKGFLSEEYFPEERRDQFIFRFKKVIMECQKHDDYQESVTWLLNFTEEYVNHSRTIADAGTTHLKANVVDDNNHLKQATHQLRTLLERFANNRSLNTVVDALQVIIDDSRRDQELRDWFSAVDAYIRKVLLQTGYVLEPDCNNEAKRLRESGRGFYDVKYKAHFDNLFDTIANWFKEFGHDPLNKRFGEDWATLTKDLLFDKEGSLKFKPDLWKDIRTVILPTVIEQVGYIPIPRIEYTDDSLDLVVENLTLQGRNLFPNIVEIEAHNYAKFSPYNAITDDHHHRIKLTLEQIQADMRDVAFYYRKKTGLPKMKDSGIADVLLGGEGLSVTIHLVSTKRDQTSVFHVEDINVKVGTLKFAIRDSKHDFLYKTLRPLATALIKKQLQKVIKDVLRTGLEYLDGQLVAVRERNKDEVKQLKKEDAEVLKRKKDETSSIRSTGDKSHFKVVTNKRDSLLADQGHPAGWVNRAAEAEKNVETGTEWRSAAFNVV